MNKDDLSFYFLILGIACTLFSLMVTYVYSQNTDFCIIDGILSNNTKKLENCKNSAEIEAANLYIGSIGVISLGFSAIIKLKSKNSPNG